MPKRKMENKPKELTDICEKYCTVLDFAWYRLADHKIPNKLALLSDLHPRKMYQEMEQTQIYQGQYNNKEIFESGKEYKQRWNEKVYHVLQQYSISREAKKNMKGD